MEDSCWSHHDRHLQHLHREIDVLKEKNRSLEGRLANAESRVSIERLQELNLDARNQVLVEELIAVEKMVKSLQQENERILRKADAEINELTKENQQYRNDLQLTEKQLEKTQQDCQELKVNLTETTKKSSDSSAELRQVRALLQMADHEKKQLSERIEKLSSNERVLVLENERLKRHAKVPNTGMTLNQLERYMSGVETDKEYWRREADLLQQRLNSVKGFTLLGEEKQDREKSVNGRTLSRGKKKTSSNGNNRAPLKRVSSVTRLSTEKLDLETPTRDRASPVREKPKETLRSRSPIRSFVSTNLADSSPSSSLFQEVVRERDELRNLLSSLEKRVMEIHSQVRILTQERDHLQAMHDESRGELRRVREEMLAVKESYGCSSTNTHNLLCRTEEELERSLCDLRRLTCEFDQLKEQHRESVVSNENKERELRRMHSEIHTLEEQLREANYKANQLRENLSSKENSEHSYIKQLDATIMELDLLKKRFNDSLKEGSQLKTDITHLSRTSRSLQQDLQETTRDREELQLKVQEYENELKRFEDLLTNKEHEEGHLLETCHDLRVTIDEKETQIKKLQSDIYRLQNQVEVVEDELRKTQDALKAVELDNVNLRSSGNLDKQQIVSLESTVDNLSRQLRSSQHEREELLNDLRDLRDICNRLETAKNALENDNTTKSLDLDQMAAQVDDLNQENDQLRDQLDQEQENRVNLETILQTSRDKERQTQLDYQEKASEAVLLKERIIVLTEDLECARCELDRVNAHKDELERDIDRFHRNLANERFEKERLQSELRIQSLSPPPKMTSTSRSLRSPTLGRSSPVR